MTAFFRTHAKTNKVLALCLALLALIAFGVFSCKPLKASAAESPYLEAKAYTLVDTSSHLTVASSNADAQLPIASTTKIMTCLLAVEAIEEGKVTAQDMVTVGSDYGWGLEAGNFTSAELKEGEVISLGDLLYCAMLISANDACNVIATYIAGDIPSFVALMNTRAQELGLSGTVFTCTNGSDDSGNLSTAADLAILAQEAITHPYFTDIVGSAHYTTAATNMAEPRVLANSNAMLTSDGRYGSSYYYEGTKGIKTGFTKDAGYCLVSWVCRDGASLISVVLGCDGPYIENDDYVDPQEAEFGHFIQTIALYEWFFANFHAQTVVEQGTVVSQVPVTKGEAESVNAVTKDSLSVMTDQDISSERISFEANLANKEIQAPVKQGDLLGTVTVCIDGTAWGSLDLVADKSVAKARIYIIIDQVVAFAMSPLGYGVIGGIVLLIIALIIVLIVVRRKKTPKQLGAHSGGAQGVSETSTTPKLIGAHSGTPAEFAGDGIVSSNSNEPIGNLEISNEFSEVPAPQEMHSEAPCSICEDNAFDGSLALDEPKSETDDAAFEDASLDEPESETSEEIIKDLALDEPEDEPFDNNDEPVDESSDGNDEPVDDTISAKKTNKSKKNKKKSGPKHLA